MSTTRLTMWAELVTYRDRWGYARVKLGKLLRREPKNQPGFFVKVVLRVPGEVEVDGTAELG